MNDDTCETLRATPCTQSSLYVSACLLGLLLLEVVDDTWLWILGLNPIMTLLAINLLILHL